jgi:hypothetical protein
MKSDEELLTEYTDWLLGNYPVDMILDEMARQIEDAIDARRLCPEVEKAGLHPFPHALTQRSKRELMVIQLRRFAKEITGRT